MGRATLRCRCDGAFCERAVEYRNRPEGETEFPSASGVYYRAYDECRVCGHFFGKHSMDASSLYKGSYVDTTYGSIENIREKFRTVVNYSPNKSDNYWRVKRVDERWRRQCGRDFGNRPRLLDVGTGLAVFPFGMREAGWDCTIVDPDPRAVDHARDDRGMSALCGDFLGLAPEALGQYDMVTFNKVLEHVEDPVLLLKKAAQHTLDYGLVYIEVPDVEAKGDGLGFNREEFFVEHLHVFSPVSLCHLVEASGLRLTDLHRFREPSGKYTLAAFSSHA